MTCDSDKLKILLTEYQVCNEKAHSYSNALWVSGSIFVSASLLLLMESIKSIEAPKSIILTIISLATLLFWRGAVHPRHGFYFKTACRRARAIELKLKNINLMTDNDEKSRMINSWINDLDEKSGETGKINAWLNGYTIFIFFIGGINLGFTLCNFINSLECF